MASGYRRTMTGFLDRLKQTPTGKALARDPIARLVWMRARSVPHYLRKGHLVRGRAVEKYLASTTEPRLQFGTGNKPLPGWLNSDLVTGDIFLDLTRRFPLPSSSFAFAFGEHVIEHLYERQTVALLRELHRILRPGGVLRVTTPDLRKLIALYEDRNPVIPRDKYGSFLSEHSGGRPYEGPAPLFNDCMRLWGHRYIFDEEDLTSKLRAADFTSVVRREPGESPHEALRGVERHGNAWVNEAEVVCFEATR
jgi:predicted SAM-dependent methyltransferase